MRIGVGLRLETDDPEEMALSYVRAGYNAAVCPKADPADTARIEAIRAAFVRHDVLLAEVGVWNNMLDPDPAKRAANLAANVRGLALAEAYGAVCCVNIAGSFNAQKWDGPHPHDVSEEAFELTVQNVRQILDEVQPRRACYTIETMPWAIPDSAESYLRLLRAVDRPMFAVHLDPVNLINTPRRYYDTAALLRECFALLGAWIVSCHAKDIVMRPELTVHLDEAPPGRGNLDYATYLHLVSQLSRDVPVLLEHLPQGQYAAARDYVVGVARTEGISFGRGM
jgi:sugar phosphate isomerase/epimerase